MNDEKRWLRQLKKQVKKQGNRRRRRFLKNISSDPGDFDFGGDCSEAMNDPAPKSSRSSMLDPSDPSSAFSED